MQQIVIGKVGLGGGSGILIRGDVAGVPTNANVSDSIRTQMLADFNNGFVSVVRDSVNNDFYEFIPSDASAGRGSATSITGTFILARFALQGRVGLSGITYVFGLEERGDDVVMKVVSVSRGALPDPAYLGDGNNFVTLENAVNIRGAVGKSIAPTQEQVNTAIANYESISPYDIWMKFIGTNFTYNEQGQAVNKDGTVLDPQPAPLRQKATPVILPEEINLLTDPDFAFVQDPADPTKRAVVMTFLPTMNLPARLTADREFNTFFEGFIDLETENAQSRTAAQLSVLSIHRAGLATEFTSQRFNTQKSGNITYISYPLTAFSTPVAFTQAQLDANPPLGDTEPFSMLFVLRVFDQLTNAQLDGFPEGTTQAILRTNRVGVRFKLDASNVRPPSANEPTDLTAVENRLTAVETKNTEQDTSISTNTANIQTNTQVIANLPAPLSPRTDAEINALAQAQVQAQGSIDNAQISTDGNTLTLTFRNGNTIQFAPSGGDTPPPTTTFMLHYGWVNTNTPTEAQVDAVPTSSSRQVNLTAGTDGDYLVIASTGGTFTRINLDGLDQTGGFTALTVNGYDTVFVSNRQLLASTYGNTPLIVS